MDAQELNRKRLKLISNSNYEWKEILKLRFEIQNDFAAKQCLSQSNYEKILNWKLQNQETKVKKIITACPYSLVKSVTNCYSEIHHPNADMNTKIRMHVLLSIPWIGIGIASAIMAFHHPEMYGAADMRSWKSLFNKEKKTFSINDYMLYLQNVRELASKLNCDVQEIDYILCKT